MRNATQENVINALFYFFQIQHTAGIIVLFMIIYPMRVRYLQSVIHQISTRKGFTFKRQRLVINAV